MQETETVLFAWITKIPGQGVLKLSSQDAGPSLEARPDSLVKSLSHQHDNLSEDRVMSPTNTYTMSPNSRIILLSFRITAGHRQHSKCVMSLQNTPITTNSVSLTKSMTLSSVL